MNKIVFLDRDGVLISERGDYNWLPEHYQILEGLGSVLQKLKAAGYRFVVITNQGGVEKGLYMENHIKEVHNALITYLKDYNIEIEGWYYCRHHPTVSECLCRKPSGLMLENAAARFKADPKKSFFVGDHDRDEGCALEAQIPFIKVAVDELPEIWARKILAKSL